MVTIRDIAKACGVSVSTVSKALNGYGDISGETAELVRKTAEELHYIPNNAARQLKTNISHNIGVLYIDEMQSGLAHEYFAAILNGTRGEAERLGYDITFIGHNLGGRKMSFLEHARYRKCVGVVIACVDFENEEVIELVRSGLPVVTIDYTYDSVSSVLSDNMEGGYQLADHLAKLGHKKIAFIHGEKTSVTNKRLVGFMRALKDNAIEIPAAYVVQGRYHDPETSRRATRDLMALADPPTAIMYPDDYSYLGGKAELENLGLNVPEDISVTGYDGVPLSQSIQPRLTTYYQDAERIGRLSAGKLIEKIEHADTCISEEIEVSGKLLEGASVKRVNRDVSF